MISFLRIWLVVSLVFISFNLLKASQKKPEMHLRNYVIDGKPANEYVMSAVWKALETGCRDGIQVVEYNRKDVRIDEAKVCRRRVELYQKAVEAGQGKKL